MFSIASSSTTFQQSSPQLGISCATLGWLPQFLLHGSRRSSYGQGTVSTTQSSTRHQRSIHTSCRCSSAGWWSHVLHLDHPSLAILQTLLNAWEAALNGYQMSYVGMFFIIWMQRRWSTSPSQLSDFQTATSNGLHMKKCKIKSARPRPRWLATQVPSMWNTIGWRLRTPVWNIMLVRCQYWYLPSNTIRLLYSSKITKTGSQPDNHNTWRQQLAWP